MIIDVNEKFPVSAALPAAMCILHRCDPSKLFHESQMKRHPLAAYNVSTSAVLKRFGNVLDALELVKFDHIAQPPIKAGDDGFLLEATDHLLDSLMEHMEDCEKIVGSFFEDPAQRANKKKIEQYKRRVDPYRDFIGKLDNFIKHQQGRLRLITFYDAANTFPGYYIEGLVEAGVVGPVTGIHPGGNSAFSYARDLRFHMANVFGVSRILANYLMNLGVLLDPDALPSDALPTAVVGTWADTLRRIASLAAVCYPDEVRKPFPGINFIGEEVRIRFPDNTSEHHSFPNGTKVTSSFAGDGVTRTFKLPYFAAGTA
ncbi:hypothetical protein [Geothrix terrae]|uniref:hypothetical protein n=1 Tax=Geothrix terrae TaxID=2922720 RepID=UPI001FAB9C89|nr:hypothetical protein [Geothrix terrae]